MDADTVIRLRRVVLGLARQLNAASMGEGLTPAEASVLGIVVNRGPLGLADLTEIEGLNPTMLSRIVGKLDSFGLIRRLRDPEDSRIARVEHTREGKHSYQRISAQRAAIISERSADMPAEQQAALVAALPALEHLAERLRAVQRGHGLAKPKRAGRANLATGFPTWPAARATWGKRTGLWCWFANHTMRVSCAGPPYSLSVPEVCVPCELQR